jgi:hypothetical protein
VTGVPARCRRQRVSRVPSGHDSRVPGRFRAGTGLPVSDDAISRAVAEGDLDRLVRLVGELCTAADWPGVVRLRDRCRQALERGLQLWPAAEYAEYRLALEAPGTLAGPVVVEGAGRFALGPLWEVAASTHAWQELAGHIPAGPARALAAHERVIRGEDLRGDTTIDATVMDLPLVLQAWEPSYPVAVFRADGADFPSPPRPALQPACLPAAGRAVDDEESIEALLELARPWVEQSNGRAEAVVVEGRGEEAIAALGQEEVGLALLTGAEAMAWMAWAGASGGAYGRRRGAASGRLAAWWAVATVAGLAWPPRSDEMERAVGATRWLAWEPPGAGVRWSLHLAGDLPGEGLAFAVAAVDSRREGEEEGEEEHAGAQQPAPASPRSTPLPAGGDGSNGSAAG